MNSHAERAQFNQQIHGYFITCEPCKGRGFDESFSPCQPCDGYGKVWINEPRKPSFLGLGVLSLFIASLLAWVLIADSCSNKGRLIHQPSFQHKWDPSLEFPRVTGKIR